MNGQFQFILVMNEHMYIYLENKTIYLKVLNNMFCVHNTIQYNIHARSTSTIFVRDMDTFFFTITRSYNLKSD